MGQQQQQVRRGSPTRTKTRGRSRGGRGVVVAVLSSLLGLGALIGTQYVARHDVKPVLKACQGVVGSHQQIELIRQGYHRYEPLLGGSASCLATQFVHRLLYERIDGSNEKKKKSNEREEQEEESESDRKSEDVYSYRKLGCAAWLLKLSLLLPAYALVMAEAATWASSKHRTDAAGGVYGYIQNVMGSWNQPWIGQPMIVLVLMQLLGISTAFGLMWLPSLVMTAGSSDSSSEPRGTRTRSSVRTAHACLVSILAIVVAYITVLAVSVESTEWMWAAGIVGGPALVLVPVVVKILMVELPSWFKTAKQGSSSTAVDDSTAAWIRCYGLSGAVAFCAWSTVLFGLFATYAIHYKLLWKDLRGSNGFVHHALIDAAALYTLLLLFVMYHSLWTALECVLQSVIFGPGAALSMALAQLENNKIGGTDGTSNVPSAKGSTGIKKKVS